LKPVVQAKAKEQQVRKPESVSQTFGKQIHVDKEVAEAAGVSAETVRKVERVNAKATPELRAAMNANAVTINTAAGLTACRAAGNADPVDIPKLSAPVLFLRNLRNKRQKHHECMLDPKPC
jgi:transcriptional regulator with XRE-family HTH domain